MSLSAEGEDVEVADALAGVVAVSVEEAMPSVCLELGAGRNDTHVLIRAALQGVQTPQPMQTSGTRELKKPFSCREFAAVGAVVNCAVAPAFVVEVAVSTPVSTACVRARPHRRGVLQPMTTGMGVALPGNRGPVCKGRRRSLGVGRRQAPSAQPLVQHGRETGVAEIDELGEDGGG